MTNPAGSPPPEGATPLDDDELDELIPQHVTTQRERNEWEQENILAAFTWAQPRRRRAPEDILTEDFARELHRRMFDQTWRRAGEYRKTLKNIGVAPELVRINLKERLADVTWWHHHQSFGFDEIAARLHHAVVGVHPWPNGNGRWSRQLADSYLHSVDRPPFTWGGEGKIGAFSTLRRDYLAALRAADNGDVSALMHFVRR